VNGGRGLADYLSGVNTYFQHGWAGGE